MAEIPARARVHRRDQAEPRRERDAAGGAGDAHPALFERLAQHLEGAAGELGQLVEEQDAVVRQRDLPGAGQAAAADERRFRAGVMRCAERPLAQECAARRQQAGHRVHRGDVERLIEGQRREHAGQAAGEHRLAGPGRADEQEMVATGGGDLERTARRRPARARRRGLAGEGASRPADRRRRAVPATWCVRRADTPPPGPACRWVRRARREPRRPRARSPPAASASETPSRRSPAAIGRTPRVGSTAPSSDSSPTMASPGPSSRGIAPAAARIATAIGKSKAAPALRRSAGARFTVIRCGGKSNPELRMAARTRSRLSRTLASGSPTMAKTGRPKATSASTDTGSASTPTRVALCT